MRQAAIATMGTATGLVLVFAYHAGQTATSTSTTRTASGGTTAAAGGGTSGTFTGEVQSTEWGPVQVRITVAAGRITAADAPQHPTGHRSDRINAEALPVLISETVQTNGQDVQAVSGASVTSEGYRASLQSALSKAGL